MSRTQRCGNCDGCLAKPCRQCTYCLDNPQNGGPGVKKQSCIARRCIRVMEGRLQRESANHRAKVGCGSCEECRQPDCGVCLICLDKRVFGGRFLPDALCAKKRCVEARSLDDSPVSGIGRATPSPNSIFGRHRQRSIDDGKGIPAINLNTPRNGFGHVYNHLSLRKRLLGQMDDNKKARRSNGADSPPALLNYRSQLITNSREDDYGSPRFLASYESLPTPPPSVNPTTNQQHSQMSSSEFHSHHHTQLDSAYFRPAGFQPDADWSATNNGHALWKNEHKIAPPTKNTLQHGYESGTNRPTVQEPYSLLRDRLSGGCTASNGTVYTNNTGATLVYNNLSLQQQIPSDADCNKNYLTTSYCNGGSQNTVYTMDHAHVAALMPHSLHLNNNNMMNIHNVYNYNLPGAIVTQPMGPMDQTEVVLQQL